MLTQADLNRIEAIIKPIVDNSINLVKTEISGVQSEMIAVKTEMATLKTDIILAVGEMIEESILPKFAQLPSKAFITDKLAELTYSMQLQYYKLSLVQ